jgi:hypothetical protein
MKPGKVGKEEAHTVQEIISYLQELPLNLHVRTMLVEDETFTVLVDTTGNARTVKNNNDNRWFLIELPVKQ